MKSLRLLIAMLVCACCASVAVAADANKATNGIATAASAKPASAATSKAGAACSAEMAAQCTPAMKAACEKNAAVAAAMGCETSNGVTTMNVVAAAPRAKTIARGGDCCAAKGARGTNATTVVAAVASPGKRVDAEFIADTKGVAGSAAIGYAAHAAAAAHDCASCESWIACEQDVRALRAKAQVVPLKNGVMVVYTADSPGDVRVLQSAVAKRNDRMLAALSANSTLKLCDQCKQLRGAMASGKLYREVVNVERGCMTLMTSTDRGVVEKIRAMNGQPVAVR